ncbi:hypothetical protein [Dictyobacter halimunensis]|uniref:hypothetical protein n=1 Tax=Dictyobacter halimunensis TaxID=3026934 RepID=UPI0030C6F8E6
MLSPDQSDSVQKPPRQPGFKPAEAAPSQENEQPRTTRQQAQPAKKLSLTQRYAADQLTTSVPSDPNPPDGSRMTPDATNVVSPTSQRSQQQSQAIVEPESGVEIVRRPTTPPRASITQAAGKPATSPGTPPVLTQGQAMAIQNILRQAVIASTSSVINIRRKPYHKQHADFWIVVLVIACIICLLGLYIVFTYKMPRMSLPHPTALATITQTVSRI